MKNYVKCTFCGRFISLKKWYYYYPDADFWDFEPPDPEPICEKCYKECKKSETLGKNVG